MSSWQEELRAFCDAHRTLPDMTSERAKTLVELITILAPPTKEQLEAFLKEVKGDD